MDIYIEIPTWNNGIWETTKFKTREIFKSFIESLFKEPGKYEFDETTLVFNEQSRKFHTDGTYCKSPVNSKDYIKYWGSLQDEHILSEKSKCRQGVIYINNGKTWYLTRDYYFWINFLPIYDKHKKKFDFPNIWDSQYHAFLYELLAELDYKHVALLKKRQWGGTYIHDAKLINRFWFEEGVTLKIGASLKDYINEKGAWKFLNEYRNFLNSKTGWYRGCDPDKVLTWQQRQKGTIGDKDVYQGNMSVIVGSSFEKDPTSGVGGNVSIFYHEEAGIAPKMGTTYEFIRPALSSGMITTGIFIASGSVGDLDQCQPLKEMILNPVANSIYPVETDLLDDKGTKGLSGLFIPEHWSMPPFIDDFGNSQVEAARNAVLEERLVWKKNLDPATYQLRISQKPINIYEAFAHRKESIFPLGLIARQLQRIEENTYPIEYIDLERNAEGKIEIKNIYKKPIDILGDKIKTLEDKTSVMCMYERPLSDNPEWGTYYMSIDPVKEGKSTSSSSLCSAYVYRTDSETTRIDGKEIENYIDRGKIVFSWCGRYDDLKKTHEKLELIAEFYKAQIICEANISEFITYMQYKRKQHMLVTRSRLLSFNKDQKGTSESYQEYGWKNTGNIFQHLLSYAISYLKEEIDIDYKSDGTVVKTTYGIERIPDAMLLKEMLEYQDDKGNYDRLVSFCALVAFVSMENANRGFRKRVEKVVDLEKPNNFSKFLTGGSQEQTFFDIQKKPNPWSKPSNPFRYIR